ncbi:uncharacterized protein LOC129881655 [Solanum dulcamara]|uniref:uncharacterized protein LOC129881655 n=1 Tax=Solanum dulcamara TaxID=45834 RepID=UPI00248640DE|nr:uncharacterized protein LOC129881655 [Solanum dulcamara]
MIVKSNQSETVGAQNDNRAQHVWCAHGRPGFELYGGLLDCLSVAESEGKSEQKDLQEGELTKRPSPHRKKPVRKMMDRKKVGCLELDLCSGSVKRVRQPRNGINRVVACIDSEQEQQSIDLGECWSNSSTFQPSGDKEWDYPSEDCRLLEA